MPTAVHMSAMVPMFLSLVRPDRISSPMTSTAAVTISEDAVIEGARVATRTPSAALSGAQADSVVLGTPGPALAIDRELLHHDVLVLGDDRRRDRIVRLRDLADLQARIEHALLE